MTLFVSTQEAKHLLTIPDSLRAIEQAYRLYGQERNVLSDPSASFMIVPNDAPTMFWMKGAHLKPLGVVGVFFGAQFGDYYFMVTDCKTGTLRGIVEQAWLTKRRTAVTGVVTAMKLARKGSTVAAVVGAGQIGEEVVRVMPHAFRLSDFRVASRTFEGASALVERLKPEVDTPLRAVASAEEAIRGADIVITITLASAPFVRAGWLKEGALLVSMGGVHEVDYDVLAEIDRVVVDDSGYALLRGDFASWIDRGVISLEAMRQRIDANIGEIVYGSKPGRSSDSERILAVIQGMAVCDLTTAVLLLEKAAAAATGQSLKVEPQMTLPELAKMKPRAQSIASGLRRRRSSRAR
jgi:ornithine cyclodeaminase